MKTILVLFLVFCATLCLCVAAEAQVTAVEDAHQYDTIKSQGLKSVALASTSTSASAYLDGQAYVDSKSIGQITYRWYRMSGPTTTIEKPDSLSTRVFGLVPGEYRFRLIVTDKRINKADTSYKNISVLRP